MFGLDEIKELIKSVKKNKLSKFKLKNGDFEVVIETNSKVVAVNSVNQVEVQPVETSSATTNNIEKTEIKENKIINETINSPMVGTFYEAPSPDAKPFVKAGDKVRKGQTLCIIEAMKIMNELQAEFDCEILNVLVENGTPVEYDMPIFEIKKL